MVSVDSSVSPDASTLTESRRHAYQVGEGAGLHFLHHLPAVRLHGALADAKLAADLFVRPARDDERHDLPFPTGQRCVTPPKRTHLRRVAQGRAAAAEGAANRSQEY